jgi:hypothetical protein
MYASIHACVTKHGNHELCTRQAQPALTRGSTAEHSVCPAGLPLDHSQQRPDTAQWLQNLQQACQPGQQACLVHQLPEVGVRVVLQQLEHILKS